MLDDENRSWPIVSPNPYGPENILHYFESFDDANETAIILHWTLVALVITMAIITLIVDPGRFHGPDQDEEELNVLRILSLHHILVPVVFFCANRKKYMNILDTEDPNEPVNTGESNVRSGSRKQSSGRRKSSEPKGGDLEHRTFEDINLTPAYVIFASTVLHDFCVDNIISTLFHWAALKVVASRALLTWKRPKLRSAHSMCRQGEKVKSNQLGHPLVAQMN